MTCLLVWQMILGRGGWGCIHCASSATSRPKFHGSGVERRWRSEFVIAKDCFMNQLAVYWVMFLRIATKSNGDWSKCPAPWLKPFREEKSPKVSVFNRRNCFFRLQQDTAYLFCDHAWSPTDDVVARRSHKTCKSWFVCWYILIFVFGFKDVRMYIIIITSVDFKPISWNIDSWKHIKVDRPF